MLTVGFWGCTARSRPFGDAKVRASQAVPIMPPLSPRVPPCRARSSTLHPRVPDAQNGQAPPSNVSPIALTRMKASLGDRPLSGTRLSLFRTACWTDPFSQRLTIGLRPLPASDAQNAHDDLLRVLATAALASYVLRAGETFVRRYPEKDSREEVTALHPHFLSPPTSSLEVVAWRGPSGQSRANGDDAPSIDADTSSCRANDDTAVRTKVDVLVAPEAVVAERVLGRPAWGREPTGGFQVDDS